MKRFTVVAVATLLCILWALPIEAQGTALPFTAAEVLDVLSKSDFAYADPAPTVLSVPTAVDLSRVRLEREVTAHWIEDMFGFGLGLSYFALSLTDWRQTIYGLSTGDFAEGNPAPNAILTQFGTTGLSAFKVGITFAVTAIYEYVWITWGRRGSKWARIGVLSFGAFMNGLQGFAVEHNSRLTITGAPLITF